MCDTIAKRGGRLAGAGIVGILQKIEDFEDIKVGKRKVVAMDGGLYENYPQYRRYLKEGVTELLGTEKMWSLNTLKMALALGLLFWLLQTLFIEHDFLIS